MSLEGIWTSEIYGPFGWENRGVLVFENGRIIGGDNRHCAMGKYEAAGATVEAQMVIHYYGPPRTVFGEKRERFEVLMTGELEEGVISGRIAQPDRPDFTMEYRLTKRMDLTA